MRTTMKRDERAQPLLDAAAGAEGVHEIPVTRIRPEEGLGRKRDREGHRELQRSIEQFGVLTPITVRPANDGSGDYLLIKGEGRTLACRLLGLPTVPAIVAGEHYAEHEKVQQFLVENVARLKMRPVDRALLIHRAREAGEETSSIARRFGLSAATVRRLLSQLEGATQGEVAALNKGEVTLAVHAVVSRHVRSEEREAALSAVISSSIRAKDLETLFIAIGWQKLSELGSAFAAQRLLLLAWVCNALQNAAPGSFKDRLQEVASQLPTDFSKSNSLMVSAR